MCDTQLTDNVLGISFSFMVTVCDWMLMTRNGPVVGPNSFLYLLVVKDDESLSFVAVSGALATNTKLCGLNAGFSRTQRS